MKLNQQITLTLGLLAAGTVGYGQNTTSPAPAGVIGQQYTEVSFGLQDVKGVSAYGQTLTAGATTPYLPGQLDTGGSYSYSWIGGANNGHAHTLSGYARAYTALRGMKPFIDANLGWQWSKTRFAGSERRGLWGSAIGVEIPAGTVVVTPRISYADDFESSKKSEQGWTYQVEANHWFSPRTAVFGSIGYTNLNHSSQASWNYLIGLRGRF